MYLVKVLKRFQIKPSKTVLYKSSYSRWVSLDYTLSSCLSGLIWKNVVIQSDVLIMYSEH